MKCTVTLATANIAFGGAALAMPSPEMLMPPGKFSTCLWRETTQYLSSVSSLKTHDVTCWVNPSLSTSTRPPSVRRTAGSSTWTRATSKPTARNVQCPRSRALSALGSAWRPFSHTAKVGHLSIPGTTWPPTSCAREERGFR